LNPTSRRKKLLLKWQAWLDQLHHQNVKWYLYRISALLVRKDFRQDASCSIMILKLLAEWRIEEGCCKRAILSFHNNYYFFI
jgi:hypothetical protein